MTKTLMKGCEYLLRTTTAGELFTPEDFSDEQRQIADTTEQFIKKDVLPVVEAIDQQDFDLVVDLMRKSAELGLLMAEIPEEYGGLELDKASGMLLAENWAPAGHLPPPLWPIPASARCRSSITGPRSRSRATWRSWEAASGLQPIV